MLTNHGALAVVVPVHEKQDVAKLANANVSPRIRDEGLRPCLGVDAVSRPRHFSVGYEEVRARSILGPELLFLSFSPDVSRAHDEVVLPHNHLARAETTPD